MAKNKVAQPAPDFIPDDAPEFISDAEAPDFISDEEAGDVEGPGMISRLLDAYESVMGAPARQALIAPTQGKNPITAWKDQMGADPNTAPSGPMVAEAYGVSDKPISTVRVGGGLMGLVPGILGLSPADIVGGGIDLTASPDMAIGPVVRGGGKAVSALRGLDEVGAIGRNVAPAKKLAIGAPKAGLETVEKVNREAIINAARNLGVPTFEGQLGADKFTQRLESILQESPSFVGRMRQEKTRKAFEKIGGNIEAALPKTNKSKFVIGEDVQAGILSDIEKEREPISKLYETVKESAGNIQVPPMSKGRISKNVGKLEKFSGPAQSLAERISKDILVIDNLDDIKKLKTTINKSLSPGASSAERDVVTKVSRRLKALEENTVLREAVKFSTETKDPQAKVLIESLIGDRRAADKSWRGFMGGLSQLSKGLGKGQINDAYQAERFIKDMVPEKLVDRLSTQDNAGFVKFFANKYPERAKEIFALQKEKILGRATKGESINIKNALDSIDNLSDEVRNLMFTPEQLKTFADAKTYVRSWPVKFNPSDTATKQEYAGMLRGVYEALTLNARDAAIVSTLKAKGAYSPEGFEALKRVSMKGASGSLKSTSAATRIKALGGGYHKEDK